MGENKIEDGRLWDFDDLMHFLHKVPESTVREHIATGLIPSVKLGRKRRFIPDDIKRAIKKL